MEVLQAAIGSFATQCEKFPVQVFSAGFLCLFVLELRLPPLDTSSAAANPPLLECMAFLLPIFALFGAVATGEFCDWARAQVGDLAKQLDHRAGISEDWRLHPPELADAYQEWCRRQPYRRVVPWLPFGVSLMLYLKQPSSAESFDLSLKTGLVADCTINLLKALLDRRLSPFGDAAMQWAAHALRICLSTALCLKRDQGLLGSFDSFSDSYIGLMTVTAMTMLLICMMTSVALEYTFSTHCAYVFKVFVVFSLRFHIARYPMLTLADIDRGAVVGCLAVTVLLGQVALVIRYWVGVSNIKCFLRAHRVAPPSPRQPDERQHRD